MRHRPRRRVVGAFRPETAFWKITPARGTVSSFPMVPGVSTPRISSPARRSRSVQLAIRMATAANDQVAARLGDAQLMLRALAERLGVISSNTVQER